MLFRTSLFRPCLIGLIITLATSGFAQYPWQGVSIPGMISSGQRIFIDEANETVFVTGINNFEGSSLQHSAVLAWRNDQWDTIVYASGFIRHMVSFRDTIIIAGGNIVSIEGEVVENILYHHDNAWHAFSEEPTYFSVNRFRIIEDTLYAAVSGASTPYLRLINGQWVPFGSAAAIGVWGLDIVKYNGEFYGSLNGAPGGHVVSKLVNGVWSGFSEELVATISMAGTLVEYQGDLYIGGQLSMNEDLPGQGIFRWDGTAFHSLGQGLQTYLTNNNGWCPAQDMTVNDGLLFVATPCNYAGGAPSTGMAIWDGETWCSMPGDLESSGYVNSIGFLSDTLYVTCGLTIDGVDVGGMARFIGPSYTEDCQLFASLANVNGSEGLTIATTDDHTVLVTGLEGHQHPYTFFDAQGRIVAQGLVNSIAGRAYLPFPSMVPAVYVLRIDDHAAQVLQLPQR